MLCRSTDPLINSELFSHTELHTTGCHRPSPSSESSSESATNMQPLRLIWAWRWSTMQPLRQYVPPHVICKCLFNILLFAGMFAWVSQLTIHLYIKYSPRLFAGMFAYAPAKSHVLIFSDLLRGGFVTPKRWSKRWCRKHNCVHPWFPRPSTSYEVWKYKVLYTSPKLGALCISVALWHGAAAKDRARDFMCFFRVWTSTKMNCFASRLAKWLAHLTELFHIMFGKMINLDHFIKLNLHIMFGELISLEHFIKLH